MEDIKVANSIHLSLTMDDDLLDRIDAFRFSQKYMSRSAAIRDLLITALDQQEEIITDSDSENPK